MGSRSFMTIVKALVGLVCALSIAGCVGPPASPQTLGDIDVGQRNKVQPRRNSEAVVDREQIKAAYYSFIETAAEDDQARYQATNRLAELELELGAQIAERGQVDFDEQDERFTQSVQRTIRLLTDSLKNFPSAAENDHTRYQLAKAYDQVGESEKALSVLEHLVRVHPSSPYYVEAKFRIAENAFIHQEYFKAEAAYTAVLNSSANENFYEKALFKRGWSRYKLELYRDALDDYYGALAEHSFDMVEPSQSQQALQNEYLRAIGLAFVYLGGAPAMTAYFADSEPKPLVYRTYTTVGRILFEQQRYQDAVAVYRAYVSNYPQTEEVVAADLAALQVWQDAGFFNQFVSAFENFYHAYHGGSSFWQHRARGPQSISQNEVSSVIRQNIVLLAGYYHNRYLKKHKREDFTAADRWYQRYLQGYQTYARQDKIHPLYAELLRKSGADQKALHYYELAAFDGHIVVDKEAAYAAISLSASLYESTHEPDMRDKHLGYAQLYGELYPNDDSTINVIEHAVQVAYRGGLLEQTVILANIMPDHGHTAAVREVAGLKAQAYLDLGHYHEAELMYQALVVEPDLTQDERAEFTDRLVLSIYRQAEAAQQGSEVEQAARHFIRAYRQAPQSELAVTALYDATTLFVNNAMWDDAIDYLNLFKREYPDHPYQQEVTRKLSVAFLNTDRSVEAAQQFERLTDFASSDQERMAALWQAAELYQSKQEWLSAVRAYREYAHTYTRPYEQNMEAMHQLADIYLTLGERQKRAFWLRKMINADGSVAATTKTERTRYVAANAAFALALLRQEDYTHVALVHPLAESLRRKKTAMQDTVRLFGQASVYGHEDFITESTFHIGEIYRGFASALLQSERPRNLNAAELEQYNFLLEDQAFPFEDMAIEFYQTNVERIADGVFDDWVQTSLNRLAELYPARYKRSAKVETHVERF